MAPKQLPGHRLFVRCEPASVVGGDFHDLVGLADGRWACILGEAPGRTVAAAGLAAELLAEIRSFLEMGSTPEAVVTHLNRWYCGRGNGSTLATLLVILIDPVENELTIINAGHVPPFVRRRDGTVESLDSAENNLPLGVASDFEFQSHHDAWCPGDCLVALTDGICDALSPDQGVYNLGRLTAQIASAPSGRAEVVGAWIMNDLSVFIGKRPQGEQRSLICISLDVQGQLSP